MFTLVTQKRKHLFKKIIHFIPKKIYFILNINSGCLMCFPGLRQMIDKIAIPRDSLQPNYDNQIASDTYQNHPWYPPLTPLNPPLKYVSPNKVQSSPIHKKQHPVGILNTFCVNTYVLTFCVLDCSDKLSENICDSSVFVDLGSPRIFLR